VAQKLLLSLFSLLAFAALLEIGARVGSYLYYGRNPYYLFYGFRSWTNEQGEGHSDKRAGYFKFPAHEEMRYGTPEPFRTNNHGFRGPDFEARKPPDTYRIVCLGASSTFGYTNRDQGTYPFLLEKRFAEARAAGASGPRVEVINAGIPHLNSSNIRALLEQEIFGYEPDLITFYEGYNDATYPLAETRVQRWSRAADEYSAAYAALRKLVEKLGSRAMQGRWTRYQPGMDLAAVGRQLGLHHVMLRENLSAMLLAARERGVDFVLVKQPVTMWFEAQKRGLASGPRPGYEEEYRRVEERLRTEGAIPGYEATLYVHHALMELVEELAREHGFPLVDNVALLEGHVEDLVTTVHLSEAANERLASALHETIAPRIGAPGAPRNQ